MERFYLYSHCFVLSLPLSLVLRSRGIRRPPNHNFIQGGDAAVVTLVNRDGHVTLANDRYISAQIFEIRRRHEKPLLLGDRTNTEEEGLSIERAIVESFAPSSSSP